VRSAERRLERSEHAKALHRLPTQLPIFHSSPHSIKEGYQSQILLKKKRRNTRAGKTRMKEYGTRDELKSVFAAAKLKGDHFEITFMTPPRTPPPHALATPRTSRTKRTPQRFVAGPATCYFASAHKTKAEPPKVTKSVDEPLDSDDEEVRLARSEATS